jgi:hypothetical protein
VRHPVGLGGRTNSTRLPQTLSNPAGWFKPVKVIDGGGSYPQLIHHAANGTHSLARSTARFYMYGLSNWEIFFKR